MFDTFFDLFADLWFSFIISIWIFDTFLDLFADLWFNFINELRSIEDSLQAHFKKEFFVITSKFRSSFIIN